MKIFFFILILLILSCIILKIYYEIQRVSFEKQFRGNSIHLIPSPTQTEEHKTLPQTGYDIHYYVSGKAGNPLLFLLHPAFSDHRVFDAQVDAFSTNFRVITIDLIGHGLSQVQKSGDQIEASVRHLAEIMQLEGYSSAHLVGVSMGSLVAQSFASEYPEKTSSYAALGGYRLSKENTKIANADRSSNLGLILRVILSFKSFRQKTAQITAYTISGQEKFYQSASFYTRKSFRVMPGLNKLSCQEDILPSYPCLILVGDQDIPLSHKMSSEWHQYLPESEFHLISEAGHCANLDNPQQFNQLVLNFICR